MTCSVTLAVVRVWGNAHHKMSYDCKSSYYVAKSHQNYLSAVDDLEV